MSKKDLMALALQHTTTNVVKRRGSSGKKTYLDRFVDVLTDENGEPSEMKSRVEVISLISLDICQEARGDEQKEDPALPDFTLTKEGDTEDDNLFAKINKKVKPQVAAAVANNQNSTSISYNPKYKDKFEVVKDGHKIGLAKLD